MKIILGSKGLKLPTKRPVLTIGNFDGVHLGHQEIFRRVRNKARKLKGTSVVYTFEPHPVKTVAPKASPKLIQTYEQKMSSIGKQGIDICIVERFTPSFAKLHHEEFFEKIILKKIAPVAIVVGHDLTFGRRRLGTVELLERLCADNGIDIEVVEPVFLHETLISSTQIRNLITKGDVASARKMMGHPFELTGNVVKGLGIGGELGFHTANIVPNNESTPPSGVYATRAIGRMSVTNIGCNPTFGGASLTIETHIPEFSKNLYGKEIAVEFYERLRDEITFDNPAALKKQIAKDIERTRRFFEHEKI